MENQSSNEIRIKEITFNHLEQTTEFRDAIESTETQSLALKDKELERKELIKKDQFHYLLSMEGISLRAPRSFRLSPNLYIYFSLVVFMQTGQRCMNTMNPTYFADRFIVNADTYQRFRWHGSLCKVGPIRILSYEIWSIDILIYRCWLRTSDWCHNLLYRSSPRQIWQFYSHQYLLLVWYRNRVKLQ